MPPSTSLTPVWATHMNFFIIYLTIVTTFGPLQFGFHIAELNAPKDVLQCNSSKSDDALWLDFLPRCIRMNDAQFGLVSSIFTLGGLIGALGSGPLSTRTGRLLPMRITTAFFIVGPLLSSLAPSILVMALGRFLSGIGAGGAIVVVPIYVSEISPDSVKGFFGASTQVMCNVGILISQVSGYFLSHGNMWRIILAIPWCIGIVQLLGLIFAVESPDWLANHKKIGLAKKTLNRIRGGAETEEEIGKWGSADEEQDEYRSLLGGSENEASASQKAGTLPVGIFQVIVHPDHYKAIIAVVGVMLAQQLCGMNSVIMYSVFFLSDLLPTAAGLITVAVGVLNLIVTILCAPLSDRLGRKTCLLLSIAGMGTNALLLAIGIMFRMTVLSAVATLLFVASFAVGLGPVPFILASELVGPEAVGAAQSWGLAANWAATFVVAQFFPILNNAMPKGTVFFLFAALASVAFCFVLWWVPETNGKKNADEVWERNRREN